MKVNQKSNELTIDGSPVTLRKEAHEKGPLGLWFVSYRGVWLDA
jgi:hypothetical protein